jgi:hypothetical protein
MGGLYASYAWDYYSPFYDYYGYYPDYGYPQPYAAQYWRGHRTKRHRSKMIDSGRHRGYASFR